jgi:hypothetical protein
MNNKFFSDRQEKMIAKYLGWKQVVGSGSRPFSPGDVNTYQFIGECKTHDTEKTTISFLKSHWKKICNEATSSHKYPVLFKDNGTQLSENTWVMIPLGMLLPQIVNIIDGIKNTSTKGTSITFKLTDAKQLYKENFVDDKLNVFKFTWDNQDLAVMPLATFRDFIEENF